MKNKCFLPLVAALAFGYAASAQVMVQPVRDVHTVVIEDAVSLKVYVDSTKGTELEVGSSDAVARVARGVMTMDGATKAELRLAPDSPITHFRVQDAAKLEFVGPMDFGDKQFTVDAEDAGNVKMTKASPIDTVRTGYVILHSTDGARIVGDVPMLLTSYTLYAEDNSYIELPSIYLQPGTETDGKTYEMIKKDNGKIKVLGYVAHLNLNLSSEDAEGDKSMHPVNTKKSSSRDLEASYFWGFNNWGTHPFGHADGDAAVSYYFMNYGISFDVPVIDRSKFGMYVGLGIDGNYYHFDSPMVNFTGTGFAATTTPNVTMTSGTMDPDNWNTYFSTLAITVPVTFSFEPWKYDGVCIRLSAIPGVNIVGSLNQQYKTKAVDITANDHQMRKQMNPFMLDARLSVQYSDFGLYVQTATLSLFKSGVEPLYPVSFGIYWTMSGR